MPFILHVRNVVATHRFEQQESIRSTKQKKRKKNSYENDGKKVENLKKGSLLKFYWKTAKTRISFAW